jgi:hypothetical protein
VRNIKHFVQWAGYGRDRIGRRWPLKQVVRGGIVFYGQHGSEGAAPDLERMRKHLDLDSVKNVVMLECGDGLTLANAAGRRQGRQAGDVAKALGKWVWIPENGVAVKAAGSAEPEIHLRENSQGRVSSWLRFHPKTGLPSRPPGPSALGIEAEELPDGSTYPAAEDWNAPTADPPMADATALPPRFPALYGPKPDGSPSRYDELSEEYEKTLGEVIRGVYNVRVEMVISLKSLHDYFVRHIGQRKADRLFVLSGRPESAAAQLERLLDEHSDATFEERMEAFARASYSHPRHPEALGRLWDEHPSLNRDGLPGVPTG